MNINAPPLCSVSGESSAITLGILTVMEIPSPSVRSLCRTTVRGSPMPLLLRALISASSSLVGSEGGGAGGLLLGSLRPRQALMTVLCRWRWISASIWFQSWSCWLPLISRPSNWICWILKTSKWLVNDTLEQRCPDSSHSRYPFMIFHDHKGAVIYDSIYTI